MKSARLLGLCGVVVMLSLFLWGLQGRAIGAATPPTPTAIPTCGTPYFHEWTVWAAQNLSRRLPTSEELQAKGKLDAHGNILADTVGQQRTFWAYNFVTDTDYQLTATCKKVGAHCYIYLEDGKSVSDATLTNIMNEFDNNIYPTDTSVFGSEPNPGIDGDSHVYILLLDILDGWTGIPPHTSYIAGYFWSGNEYPTSEEPHSNEKEMFYMDIHPGDPGSTQFYGTLAHEFQHMIHWNHDPGEETWVDEGCSTFAEFICNYGHCSDLPYFLQSPDEQLTEWHGGLEDYGSAYLWTLYFWEKYGGNSTITSLVADPGKGIAGINSVLAALGYSDRFKDAFNRWTVANYLDDTTIGAGVYGYASLDLVDSGADNVNSFLRPTLSGSHNTYPASGSGDVKHWAADYYKFTEGASALTLNFDGYNGDIFGVNVVWSTSSNFASGSNTVQQMSLNAAQEGSTVVSGFGTTYQAALLIPSLQSDGAVARLYSYSASLGPEFVCRLYLPIILKAWPPVAPPTPTPTPTPPAGWINIMTEDFEGDFPRAGWEVLDDNGSSYGEYYWAKRDCRPHAGSYSGWCVGGGANGSLLSCGANYPNDARSWMIYGPFDLSDATDAELLFHFWVKSSVGYDWLGWYASTDGTDFYGSGFSGDSEGWLYREFDLTDVYILGDLTGQPAVWIAFIFTSTPVVNYPEGGYVDDIILRKYVGTAGMLEVEARPTPVINTMEIRNLSIRLRSK